MEQPVYSAGAALKRIQASGYAGRTGHPAMYDVLDRVGREFKPESYLEIGVFDGASLWSLIQAAPTLKRVVLCDIFGQDWRQWSGGPKHGEPPEAIRTVIEKSGYTGDYQLIIGNSNVEIPKLTETFDVITVDGDHTYHVAYADVKNAYPLLRVGGLLVWDDSSRDEMRRITKELIEPWKMKHLFTLDDGADTTSVYEKVAA